VRMVTSKLGIDKPVCLGENPRATALGMKTADSP
jgi:hypothetical protein